MRKESPIGKKVWLLVENEKHCYTLDKTTYTITSVKSGKEVNDYCDHYVVKSDDGTEKEIREYQTIFIPKPELKGAHQISRYLSDNHLYPDDVSDYKDDGVEGASVELSWGDWKHDHIWCDNLMGYLGYDVVDEIVTEENGSDCYSAIHYYKKSA